jgi:hypothetical protein
MNKKQIQTEQNRAFDLVQNNQIAEAKEIYQKILAVNPTNDSAHHMLSFCYVLSGEFQNALDHITEAIRLYKCCADYYNTAGSILRDIGEFEKAFYVLKEGLQCNPNNPETYNNLGLVLNDLGNSQQALKCYEASIQLKPDAPYVHFNYALTLLKTGDFKNGFREYEWRLRLTPPKPPLLPQQTDIKNRPIILHHEQGFGDTLQFIRYAKLLKENGATEISVVASPPLERLLRTCPYVDKVNADVMVGDYVIPMMSLPFVFQTDLDTIPSDVPYFQIPTSTKKLEGINVGLVWTSKKTPSPDKIFKDGERLLPSLQSVAYRSAQYRNLKPQWFDKFGTLPAKLWCLQPDATIDVDFIHKLEINDFYDTALAMNDMDLVITIDTATAHLAGALGKPTWLLLPKNAEWRWLAGENTPWYPTMRLFRQSGDWQSLLDTLYTHLSEILKEPSPDFLRPVNTSAPDES